jgi:hypothetical protein
MIDAARELRAGVAPPPVRVLSDDAQTLGWIRGDHLGFIGFADVNEAAWAAWMADLALTRRQAESDGGDAIAVVPP